jgi:peptidoglycan/LPS O-acetylase OafA/YrhL
LRQQLKTRLPDRYTMSSSMKSEGEFRIPALDGIRAVAASLVFLAHAGLHHIVPGGLGVTIFFFLSGYLITTLLRLEYETYKTVSLKRFYLRRVYRILPPMYLVLLFVSIPFLGDPAMRDVTWQGVLAQVLQVTNYFMVFNPESELVPYTGVMWSLAVEEHFYLVFPVLMLTLVRRMNYARTALALAGLCVAVLLWRSFLVYHVGLEGLSVGEPYTYLATDARFDSLLYGCIMGLWMNPVIPTDKPTPSVLSSMCLFVLGCAVLGTTLVVRDPGFRESVRYSLQGIALFPIFYCAIRFYQWPIFSWLEIRWIRWLGTISYTFYLVHFKALDVAGTLVGSSKLATAILAYVIALLFSWAMLELVEKRMAKLRKRLHPSTPAPKGATSADPVGADVVSSPAALGQVNQR